MTTPDPFPDTLEQLFGSAPTASAAPVAPVAAADPPVTGGALGAADEG